MTRRIIAALVIIFLFSTASFADNSLKTLNAGSYTIKVPDSFFNGEVTDEDKAEGITAYYRSEATLLDFDIFQFPKDNRTLEEFVKSDAEGSEVTSTEINGIKSFSFHSTAEDEGKSYNVISYVFEDNENFIKLRFWLDGDNAESETQAIINTLSR